MSSEADAIAAMQAVAAGNDGAADAPLTVASIVSALREVGIAVGDVVIVHSSLSRLGWVVGGAQAVVLALFEAVGQTGTLVMPTQSGAWSDPARWEDPAVPTSWLPTIRSAMPAFDPHLTPTRSMGQVVECFRHHPATMRSSHPAVSFAANGPLAEIITADHLLTPGLGEGSPLSRLYDLDAKVLLVGVTHSNDTSLHLAEHRAAWPSKRTYVDGASIVVDGATRWVTFEDLELDESDFDEIGETLAHDGYERRCALGAGVVRLCRQRDVVDVGAAWISAHRR